MRFFIFLFLTFLIFPCILFAGEREIIIKLKQDSPSSLVSSFRNNSPSSGANELSRKLKSFRISESRSAFVKFENYLSTIDNSDENGFSRIFILKVDENLLTSVITLLSDDNNIEYAEINKSMKLENFLPPVNDPYFPEQYYFASSKISDAWNVTLGDSNIVIGVVDSGLDFSHPDLQGIFKINYGEYGNGKESNGIDDDGNGFIDDWRGWDFVDAPFTGDPRRGDYLDPDNDPSDDNKLSHGTAVSGVIGAGFNNGIGISSTAPGCKIMVLRTFDAEGYGEEDDVASAILYGVMNGVKVFNFSFGDYIFSNLLKDVIRFAYSRNVTMITSAGNDASDRLHYPSAYDEVISVAASDPSDQKAGFSSFGETVDIFAPGFQILTTTRVGKGSSSYESNYDKFNGTSFSAPQVAGVAALLLSMNPALSNEEIRGILVSSTSYLAGQSSWDHVRASGKLNALTGLQNSNSPTVVRVYNPFQDLTFDYESVPVKISAASPLLLSYSVYYGTGQKPAAWNVIIPKTHSQALNDSVGTWNTSALPDTSYTIRLAIESNSGRTIEHRMIVFKDRTSPQITGVNFGNMIDKDNYSQVILFSTNKRTLGKIYYRGKNSGEPFRFVLADIGTPNIGFVMHDHFAILKGNDLFPDTEYEFYIEAISMNGRSAVLSDPSFVFRTGTGINKYGYSQKPYSLPFSQSCKKILDVNNNGLSDIFINEIKNNLRLSVYEFTNNAFQKISNNSWGDFKVARDLEVIGGELNLLASKSRDGYLYKATGKNVLPVNLVWSDSGNNDFWSARFADTDSDGIKEIMGFSSTGLKIMNVSAGLNEKATLPYFGLNPQANSQNVIVEDIDGDGKKEIAFINLFYRSGNSQLPDLAFNIYEHVAGNQYQRVFLDTLYRFLKADNITAGDYDGDGKKEIAIGTVSKDGDPVQYYSLIVYKSDSDNSYSMFDAADIYNYKSYTETSTSSGDIDNDNVDEIMVNTGTLFYVMKYDNNLGRLYPQFYKENINSANQIIFDFDGNGVKEIGINTINDTLLFFEKNISFTGPATPADINAYSADSNEVKIFFSPVAFADYYRIYRSDTSFNFELFDSTTSNSYSDFNVLNNKTYSYKVSAVDESNPVSESILSDPFNVFVHNQSKVLSAEYEGNGNVSLKFSQRIQNLIPNMSHFYIEGIGNPSSAAIKNNFEYLLNFNRIDSGLHVIVTKGLKDFYNSPVDSNLVSFVALDPQHENFYIVNLKLTDKLRLKIEFNMEVDSASVRDISNYNLEPFDIKVQNVSIDADRKIVFLDLENRAAIGATGKNYILKVTDVYSSTGIKISDGAGSSFGLIFNKEDLEDVYVYPNPYSISFGQNYITFANLTRSATIKIFDLTGKFIREISETDGNGGVEWDLKDNSGREVSTGIYFFNAEGVNSSGEKVNEKFGKFAVVK